MVATFTQYSFLVGVALANLSLGFAAACYLGWAPRVKALGMRWLTDVAEQTQDPGAAADAGL